MFIIHCVIISSLQYAEITRTIVPEFLAHVAALAAAHIAAPCPTARASRARSSPAGTLHSSGAVSFLGQRGGKTSGLAAINPVERDSEFITDLYRYADGDALFSCFERAVVSVHTDLFGEVGLRWVPERQPGLNQSVRDLSEFHIACRPTNATSSRFAWGPGCCTGPTSRPFRSRNRKRGGETGGIAAINPIERDSESVTDLQRHVEADAPFSAFEGVVEGLVHPDFFGESALRLVAERQPGLKQSVRDRSVFHDVYNGKWLRQDLFHGNHDSPVSIPRSSLYDGNGASSTSPAAGATAELS
jgi:hypothetical protein